MRVVATAGHVDHGKSSLVLALTGTDPDRFAEEKARGLTIDLGFAFAPMPSGEVVAFVDVPGHVRFQKNMLAGVGAVEAAALIVAANEGWMPQSEEHLRILDLLGIRHAIAVVTKADLVDSETLELACLEVADHLATSALAGAHVVACDSKSGRGLDDVRVALDALVAAAPLAIDRGRPRLWIDRVFAARGAGTVVTGTLAGGSLRVDEELVVVPRLRKVRVRGLESHHEQLAEARAGSRVAVNLAGVDHHEVQRGNALVRPGQWAAVSVVDVALVALPGAEVPRRGACKAYIGSGEHDVRVRVLDPEARYARIHLTTALPLAPGDRLVLREPGRQATVGGCEVLDINPPGRAAAAPERLGLAAGERQLAARTWLRVADLVPLVGVDEAGAAALAADLLSRGRAVRAGDWIADAAAAAATRSQAVELVARHHEREPVSPGLDLAVLAQALGVDAGLLRYLLEGVPDLAIEQGRAHLPGRAPALTDDPETTRLVAALDAQPFMPPSPAELGAAVPLVRALVRAGVLCDLDGIVFSAGAVTAAEELVAGYLRDNGTMTVAQARDVLGSSRRYVLALLAHFDAAGVTRRRGDERILGPRGARSG